MTKVMGKRIGRIERRLGPPEFDNLVAVALRRAREKDAGLAKRLRDGLSAARGDLRAALGNLSADDLETLLNRPALEEETVAGQES